MKRLKVICERGKKKGKKESDDEEKVIKKFVRRKYNFSSFYLQKTGRREAILSLESLLALWCENFLFYYLTDFLRI